MTGERNAGLSIHAKTTVYLIAINVDVVSIKIYLTTPEYQLGLVKLEKKVQDKETEEIVGWLRDNDDKLRKLFGDLGGERKVLELIRKCIESCKEIEHRKELYELVETMDYYIWHSRELIRRIRELSRKIYEMTFKSRAL